jgi:PAS domain S-box-containing protein
MDARHPRMDAPTTTALNAAPYAVLLVDGGGRIVYENPTADALFGSPLGALAGHAVEELMPDGHREAHARYRANFTQCRERRPMREGRALVALDVHGGQIPVQVSLSPFAVNGHVFTMAVVVGVTSERTSPPDVASLMAWIESSGDLHHRLVETAPIGIYRSSPDGLLLYANPALARMLGYQDPAELLGLSLTREVYADPSDRERVLRHIEDGVRSGVQARLRRRDGRTIQARITAHAMRDGRGVVVCYEGAIDDVTERLRVETDLHRMRRMESATRVAGGMAHTLSNVLTGVLGNVQLALADLPADSIQVGEDLREAQEGLLRATGMLAKLRSLGAVDHIHSERLELRAFLRAWAAKLALGPLVTVVLDVPDHPVEVDVDPVGVVEVLENLVSNALDAMPEGGQIVVALSTSTGEGGNWAELELTDTGVGMSELTLERAMEPYFSTKERQMTSAGAGLGLSLVYGIVRQHGGDVVLTSAPQRGTTVRVRLPLKTR